MKVTLKAMRVNRRMKQQEVADSLGITLERLKYLETDDGSRNMTYENLLKFCSLYRCTVDDIFLPIEYPESEAEMPAKGS